jgi:hypothetical protein
MVEYTRPYLYPQQLDALFCPERYSCIEASTKSGKTVGAIAWIVEQALGGKPGANYWWVAPGYIQAEIAYRRIKQSLTKGAFVALDTPTPRIRTLADTWLWFKSADNPDALYGEDVYAAVVDEASRVNEPSWHAVRSTLTATRGPIRLIGNVKGRKNWFYVLSRQAEAEMVSQPDATKRRMHYAKITADDAVKAGVLHEDEIEDARAVLPENIFRELYYAEPGDDTGNPFGLEHIRACSRDTLARGPAVAWGIDLAKSQDYFVCIGLNEMGEVAALHRWRRLPWGESIKRVRTFVGEDTPALVDSTGLGDPVLEQLQYERGNFHGYHFGAASKQKIMEGLAVGIQSRKLTFPKGVITNELEMFEYEFKPSGVRYSAPAGHNDDCVAALALAWQMWNEIGPGEHVMEYYRTVARRMEEVASVPVVENNRPWRDDIKAPASGFEVEIGDLLTNELDELYEQSLRATLPELKRVCNFCNKPVEGSARISDGELIWHVQCAGGGTRQQFIATAIPS